jgi:hypothetical protein
MPYKDREERIRQCKARRNSLIEKGLCVNCGKNPARPKKRMCETCSKLKKEWAETHERKPRSKEVLSAYRKTYNQRWRLKALEKICSDKGIPLKCPCGCEDLSLLDINHINGDGSQDRKENLHGIYFFMLIAKGKRSTDDLDIRCKLCNWKHYLTKEFGRQWKITYLG